MKIDWRFWWPMIALILMIPAFRIKAIGGSEFAIVGLNVLGVGIGILAAKAFDL